MRTEAQNSILLILEKTGLQSSTVRMQNEVSIIVDDLRTQLEVLHEAFSQRNHELEIFKSDAESVKHELEDTKETAAAQVSSLKKQLEDHTLESLHSEHRQALEKEENLQAQEAARMEA